MPRGVKPYLGGLLAAAFLLLAPGVAAAADETTTTVTPPATQPVHGQTATLTATVDDATVPATVPTGSVQFYLDGAAAGMPVALDGRTARLTTARLTAGEHAVRASYAPSSDQFGPSEGGATMTVARASTTVLLRVTPGTTGVAGQDLDVETTVSPTTPPLGAPTGTVTFSVAGEPFGEDTLGPDGVARGIAELSAMSGTVDVAYHGDANYAAGAGSATVTVNEAGTVITLSAAPNPANINQPVTLSMFVDSLAPSMWWPTGVLSGTIEGAPLEPAPIDGDGSTVSYTGSFTTPGAHRVTAHFAGDEDFLDADAALDVTVNGPPPPPPPPNATTRRLAARGLSLKVSPKRDRRAPFRYTVSGVLRLPGGVAKADGCRGKVAVNAKVRRTRVARKSATVGRDCRFKTRITSRRRGRIAITATFAGNARITAVSARAVKVKAG